MTSNNPFADRIRTAAQEGYVDRTPRSYRMSRRPATPVTLDASFPAQPLRISPAQRELIHDLMAERNLWAENRPAWSDRVLLLSSDHAALEALDRVAASNLITYLYGLPMRPSTERIADPAQAVPAGRYALPDYKGGVDFYRVDKPTEGRWAGKVFVAVQHGDDHTNMSRAAGATILKRIEAFGVRESSKLYGHELGVCGVCSRTLTNDESRAAGIGPVCREKNGW